jgi:hypothetical protein
VLEVVQSPARTRNLALLQHIVALPNGHKVHVLELLLCWWHENNKNKHAK